jgi:pantothenate kinase
VAERVEVVAGSEPAGAGDAGTAAASSVRRPATAAPAARPLDPGLRAAVEALLAPGPDGAPVRRLLGLTGPPGAGKSTLSAQVLAAFPGRCVVVPMDGFHLAQAELERLGRADRKGAPDTFDAAGYVALLRRLRGAAPGGAFPDAAVPGGAVLREAVPGEQERAASASHEIVPGEIVPGETVYAPEYRRDLRHGVTGAIAVPSTVPLVITEGNYLLLETDGFAPVRGLLDACWYVDPPEALRIERLVRRHVEFGKSPDAARAWVAGTDQRNAELVHATRGRADRVVREVTGPGPGGTPAAVGHWSA